MPTQVGISESPRSGVPTSSGHSDGHPRWDLGKWIELAMLLVILTGAVLIRARMFPVQDFAEYWTSAHELGSGNNPYSIERIFKLERALGWKKPAPIMNLNPPWALTFSLPLGLASSYRTTWLIWTILLTVAVCLSTRLLLTIYSGSRRVFLSESRSTEALLAFTFVPTLMCLDRAQITPYMLLGITGFLWFESKQREVMEGASLVLATAKPQLFYLIWLALLLDCVRQKKWKTIASLSCGIVVLSFAVALIRPAIFTDYFQLLGSGYTKVWRSALGGILRYPLRPFGGFILQFVPALGGLAWFLIYWRRRGDRWNWIDEMPLLITVSVLTSSYGWTLDQVVLIVPIAALAARYTAQDGKIPAPALAVYTVMNLAILILLLIGEAEFSFVVAPVLFIVALRKRQLHSSIAPEPGLASAAR